jgi:hypothetical protein
LNEWYVNEPSDLKDKTLVWVRLRLSSQNYGDGGGNGGTMHMQPNLCLTGSGQTGSVKVANLVPGKGVYLFAGAQPTNTPFPGGVLLANPDVTLGIASASPTGEATFPVDFTPATGLGKIYLQAVQFDPGAPAGFVLSCGLAVEVP